MLLDEIGNKALRVPLSIALLSVLLTAQARAEARAILYVANSGGDDVTVVDAETHRVIGSIATGPTPHGLIASPDGRRIYVTGETDDDLVAVDTSTSKVLWTAKVGDRPNEAAITPDGRHIYVPIRSSDVADVVDTVGRERIKSITVGGAPHNAYPSPDGKWMYVTSRGDDKITIIDPATMAVVGAIPLGGEPRPAAFTKDNKLTYVALTGLHGFVVADIPHRKVIDKIELPMTKLSEYSAYGYTPTHGLGLRKDEKQFWITDVYGNSIEVFSVPEHEILAKMPVGLAPNWMTFDGEFLYVSNAGSNDVSIIDTELFKEVVRIPVGMAPKRLLVVNVPDGMGGPTEPGWLNSAQRASTRDYYIKGGGILGFETTSLEDKFAAGEMTIESALVIGRKLGLRGITIDARHISAWDNTSLNQIREALDREGRILTGLLLNGNVVSDDEAANRHQLEKYKQQIQAAGRLGAPLVRIALGSTGQGDAADQAAGVERAIAALRQLLPAAREHGVKIAIENQPGPAAIADGLLRIIQGTSPEWVGACIDFGPWQSNATLVADLEKLAPYTSHVQIKTRAFDEWGEETSVSYDDVLVPLEQSGYGAALSVEFDGASDPVMGLVRTRDLIIKHWTGTAKTD